MKKKMRVRGVGEKSVFLALIDADLLFLLPADFEHISHLILVLLLLTLNT